MIGACTGFNENVSEVVYGLDGYDATMAGMKNLTWIHRNQNALTDIFSFFSNKMLLKFSEDYWNDLKI